MRFAPAILLSSLLVLAAACANIGNPSGGPRDEDPPIFISATPAAGATNVSKNKISLTFNELVNVKDPMTKVVVSPPSKRPPRVEALGRKINVQFDSLRPNTTYTIDFADAIEDNNEGNKLDGFAYTFSTGAEIDSLRISGMVLNARDLEPRKGILVGVHPEGNDSSFNTTPFIRLAKTNDKGEFVIRGLKEGNYRVFALDDKDGDYKYANPEEDIAFFPLTVTPSTEIVETPDTIFTPLGEVDTIIMRKRTRFLPNDILLRTFNSEKRPQYLTKSERIDSTRVFLKFNTTLTQLPDISVISPDGSEWSDYTLERNLANDSLVYWLPKRLVATDSLLLQTRYLRTDSTGNLALTTDTLKLFTIKPKVVKKDKNKDKDKNKNKLSVADSLARITFNIDIETPKEINTPLLIKLPVPAAHIDSAAFRLEQMVDTLWRPVRSKYHLSRQDSVSPRSFQIEYPWSYDTKYRLTVDTLAVQDLYGKVSRPAIKDFSTKKEEDYCSLRFTITGMDSIPAFVELLNTSDAVVATQPVKDNKVTFRFLSPGKYYARIIEDYNNNGIFDPGDYSPTNQTAPNSDTLNSTDSSTLNNTDSSTLNNTDSTANPQIKLRPGIKEPELAYYYPKVINLKKNWDKDENWDVFATAINLQKPDAVKKNKPERKKTDRTNNTGDLDEGDEEQPFAPTANPFDPNAAANRKKRRL